MPNVTQFGKFEMDVTLYSVSSTTSPLKPVTNNSMIVVFAQFIPAYTRQAGRQVQQLGRSFM